MRSIRHLLMRFLGSAPSEESRGLIFRTTERCVDCKMGAPGGLQLGAGGVHTQYLQVSANNWGSPSGTWGAK